MAVQISEVGHHDGSAVKEARLVSPEGVEVTLLSYGAIVKDWRIPLRGGKRPVVLGFPHWQSYLQDSCYMGAIVGRVANRTAKGSFQIGDRTYHLPLNNGSHHHHGGPLGFSKKNWQLSAAAENTVILTLDSPAGEMGYPGDVHVTVTYKLEGFTLSMNIHADVSEVTPLSLVQHHYFNLTSEPDVFNHLVEIAADHYTPVGPDMIPTGEIKPVAHSPFDFRVLRRMQFEGENQNLDLNVCLRSGRPLEKPVARVLTPDNAVSLELWTDRPGLQFYNGFYNHSEDMGHQGFVYGRHSGLCLEDQAYPNAVNTPSFPSVLVSPGSPYKHWCRIKVSENSPALI